MDQAHTIDVQVDHHPSGNLTLKERSAGTSTWSDVNEKALFANSNAAQFYQALAHRLADYASRSVKVASFKDTGPKIT